MTKVKICGLTNLSDARLAVDAGADFLGFIFYMGSQRYIVPGKAGEIVAQLRGDYDQEMPVCVGVFVVKDVTRAEISEACHASGVDAAQLVALPDPDWLDNLGVPAFAAIRPESALDASDQALRFERKALPEHLPTLLLDAFHPTLYGGTGHVASEAIAQSLKKSVKRLMLAGGLTPENVAHYVERTQPWAVDVASGTESAPGKKDHQKVRDFIGVVKHVTG